MILQNIDISEYLLFHIINPPIVICFVFLLFYFSFKMKLDSIETKVTALILITIVILVEFTVLIFFIFHHNLIIYIALYITGFICLIYMLYFTIKILKNYSDNLLGAKNKLESSEKKYRNAYQNAELYKDVFAHDVSNILQNQTLSLELFKNFQNNIGANKEIEFIIDNFQKQIKHANELISNVRFLSKLDMIVQELKPVEITQILKNLINEIKQMYKTEQIKFTINPEKQEIFVIADIYLNKLFLNLLLNGVVHNNNSNKEISINISKEIQNNSKYVKIEILDNGIGIQDEFKQELFKFLNSKSDSYYRSGLGLYVVKKLILNYKGKITIENTIKNDYKMGTKFIIDLIGE